MERNYSALLPFLNPSTLLSVNNRLKDRQSLFVLFPPVIPFMNRQMWQETFNPHRQINSKEKGGNLNELFIENKKYINC